MADHSLPVLSSTYADYTSFLKARLDDLCKGFDPAVVTATNFPVSSTRFSSAATKWQKWDGTSWVDMAATYAIAITGNAATATKLETARTINGTSFDGSANISVNTVQSITFDSTGTGAVSGTTFNGSTARVVSYNTVGAPSITGTNASGTWAIAITGNAATATTLATARTINGVSFNGSANITVTANTTASLTFNNAGSGAVSGSIFNGGTAQTISYNTVGAPSVSGANATGTWAIAISGNAATVTNGVYTTGNQTIAGDKTFSGLTSFTNGRAQVQSAGTAMWEMHIPGAHARGWYLDSSGVMRLSTTNGAGVASTVLIELDSSGNTTFTGNVAANSDERLKQNWRDLPSDFLARLAEVKMGIYDRKDTGDTQAGVSAQSMKALLFPVVREGTDGMLSVAYGNAALVAAIELAREVVSLRRELNELKGV